MNLWNRTSLRTKLLKNQQLFSTLVFQDPNPHRITNIHKATAELYVFCKQFSMIAIACIACSHHLVCITNPPDHSLFRLTNHWVKSKEAIQTSWGVASKLHGWFSTCFFSIHDKYVPYLWKLGAGYALCIPSMEMSLIKTVSKWAVLAKMVII